jgi:hypothetical protein
MSLRKYLSKGRVESILWILGGICLTGFVLKYDRSQKLYLKYVFDVLHVLLSGVVALVGLRISRLLFTKFPDKSLKHYVIALGAVLVVGGGFEVAQGFVAGDPSWNDFARDMGGGTFVLLLVLGLNLKREFSRIQRALLILGAVLIAALTLYSNLAKCIAFVQQYRSFPLLESFETQWEQDLLSIEEGAVLLREKVPAGFSKAKGDWVGKAIFKTGNGSPSIALPSVDGNWSIFKELRIDVYSPEPQPLEIILGIKDSWPNKSHLVQFYSIMEIKPGESSINIPVRDIRPHSGNRQMNVADMDYLYFIRKLPTKEITLYFDNFRLEK